MPDKAQLIGYKWLLLSGRAAVGNTCCCDCDDCNCCAGIETQGGILVTISPHDCDADGYSFLLQIGLTYYNIISPTGDEQFLITCDDVNEHLHKGIVYLHIEYDLAISIGCVYAYEADIQVSCLPLDYSFTMPTWEGDLEGTCCGDVTIRLQSIDCSNVPNSADCAFCHYCMPETLTATVTEDDESDCADIVNGTEVTLTFTDACTWESALTCLDGVNECCYKLKFFGTQPQNNKWCDWRLTVYDSGDVAVLENLIPLSGDGATQSVVFRVTFPCCDTAVTVTIAP